MSDRPGTILLLHYKFPPVPAVSGRRLGYLARYWRASGWRVLLITADWSAGYPAMDAEAFFPDADRYVVPRRDLRSLVLKDSAGVTLPSRIKAPAAGWRSRLLPPLLRLVRSFPFSYFLGDGGPLYVRAVVQRALPIIEREGVTHLFSSFGPWADHLAARRLKRRFPHLHWIADFRDLPVDPVARDRYWPRLQWAFAQWVVRPADRLTTVSRGLVTAYRRIHPRVDLLPQHLAALPPAETAPSSSVFTITYTGTLYAGVQRPEPLLRALSELFRSGRVEPAAVRLRYVGRDAATWERLVRQYDLAVGNDSRAFVARSEALALQRNSQVNLLLSWSGPTVSGILTTKLYEYLAAGRPILTLLHGPPDPELTALVEATGAGRVFSDQLPSHADALRDWLLLLYTTWQSNDGRLPWSMDRTQLEPLLNPAAGVLG